MPPLVSPRGAITVTSGDGGRLPGFFSQQGRPKYKQRNARHPRHRRAGLFAIASDATPARDYTQPIAAPHQTHELCLDSLRALLAGK
jgi:hypothetical protein